MSSTSKIVAVVVVLVIVLGGWYWWSMQATAPMPGTTGANVGVPAGYPGASPAGAGTGAQANGSPAGSPATPAAVTVPPTTAANNASFVVNTQSAFGPYVSGKNSMTLYTFANDTAGVSKCINTCAVTWPPYTVASAADIYVLPNMTGNATTFKRADGKLQVVYRGAPVYFYSKDVKPGDLKGQGVGGVWFALKP